MANDVPSIIVADDRGLNVMPGFLAVGAMVTEGTTVGSNEGDGVGGVPVGKGTGSGLGASNGTGVVPETIMPVATTAHTRVWRGLISNNRRREELLLAAVGRFAAHRRCFVFLSAKLRSAASL